MTTQYTTIQERITKAGACIKTSAILLGAFGWAALCLGAWFLLFVLDNLLDLPAGLRLPLSIGGSALVLIGFFRRVARPVARRQRPERTARMLESRYEVQDNTLINASQFEQHRFSPEESVFASRTITQSQGIFEGIRLAELLDLKNLCKWGGGAALFILLWIIYAAAFPRYVSNAWARFAMPLKDIPPASSLLLQIEPGTDIRINEGDDLEVNLAVVSDGSPADLEASPLLVWRESARMMPPAKTAGENVRLVSGAGESRYAYTFKAVRRPFAFRVFAGDSYTRSVRVDVRPAPRIKESVARVTPPPYTGLKTSSVPGPPAAISCLPGSSLEISLEFDQEIASAAWTADGKTIAMEKKNSAWVSNMVVTSAGPYKIVITDDLSGRKHTAASGEITLESDQSPIIDFTNENRNFYVNPGSTVPLVLQATDDFGIRGIEITARPPEQKKGAKQLKQWTYLGPPGSRGPVKESFELVVDPERFVPGSTWLLEASASDFRKDSRPGKSRPIILRVKTLDQMAVPRSDSLSGAFAVLKRLIAEQKQANGLTENLKVHLEEALERKTLSAHVNQMAKRQAKAKNTGSFAIALFRRHKEGERYAIRIEPLLNGEMSWVMRDILQVNKKPVDALPKFLASIEERQEYILRQLMALLGQVADSRKDSAKKVAEAEDDGRKPIPIEDELIDLKDDLEKYVREQKRLLERSKSLIDEGPEDLTDEEEEILGELAREEAKWATFFEEKLTDFSKLPDQDFADGSLSEEFNEVFQEVKLAAKELYEKKIELAVPHEQSGLEMAEELIHNLERWMPDTPDHKKWLMEEPMAPDDAPMAELPSELEDIVGELLDSEEEMTDDVEDVTSSFMDSLDKGAGWDAADGPISNMSAKGITGNQLPNQQEIGGRSGEGRSGRSHGQMVEETAEGKGGRETPTRLSPSPFETGSVEDTSKENKGGATGGGKLSGFEEEGLRGPTPPPTQQKMARLSGQQGKLRQQAEALNPKLKAYNLPTGDLEHAIAAMKQFEEDAKAGRGLRLRQTFTRILDSLDEAKSSIGRETGIHRERIKLPEWMRGEIMSGYKDGIPAGYEEMVSEYFRVLAERGSDGKKGE